MAHSLLVTVHHLLSDPRPYADLGADYFDRQQPDAERQARHMIDK